MIKPLLVIAMVILFASCSKEIEYNCKCDSRVTDESTGETTTVTQNFSYITKHKSDASSKCQANVVKTNAAMTGNGVSVTTSCVIQ